MRKIGIYNPYLETRGGGEKVCLALAELLAQQPDTVVYLITHTKVDLQPLADYFKVDLNNVRVMPISFNSFWYKVLNRLPLPGAVKNLSHDLRVYRQGKKAGFDLFINNCYQSNMPGMGKKNVYMCMFPQQIHVRQDNRGFLHGIYTLCMRQVYRILLHPSKKHAIYTYDLVTANSRYTQKYIKSYWNLDSEILYPICQDMRVSGIKKQKKIISVGRFFENVGESHHKRHDFLVKTFSKMKDLHKEGWELHIVGSVAEDVGTLKYILNLLKASDGFPIYLHFNASFKELKTIFNEATIYWHATGYGSDPKKHPEKQEHFGITTVEAMSTGAIPAVINSAGQKESVEQGANGFLWTTQSGLMDSTRQIAALSKTDLKRLQEHAEATAASFNKQAFAKQARSIFGEMV